MYSRLLVAAMALALAGCTSLPSLPPSPGAVANKTILDEQTALGVELAHQAASLAVSTAARADLIPSARRDQVRGALLTSYAAVLRVRRAYDAGNAADYVRAEIEARQLIQDVLSLLQPGR